MLVMRRFFACVLAIGGAAAFAGPAGAQPDPYAIFSRARSFWLGQRYPQLVAYDVAVAVTTAGKERTERYRCAYDAHTGAVRVDPVSDYELAHPVRPKGMNLDLFGIPVNKPLPHVDFLGVPHLAPAYSFGMAPFVPEPTPTPFNPAALVARVRRHFHDPNPRTATPSPNPPGDDLPEIASEFVSRHDYAITLVGIETIDGRTCYHLALRPTRDPHRFRLRDAWIDEHSFATWKLHEALNFVDGPGTSVAWTIHFAQIDGAQYIAEEDADAPVRAPGAIYQHAAVRFEQVRAVPRWPIRRPLVTGIASGERLDEPRD